jgi:hypothetical protein
MSIKKKEHFFRLQSGGIIPIDGDLFDVVFELCHQIAIVETDSKGKETIIGTSQGEGILQIGSVSSLGEKYPKLAESVDYLKMVLVSEAMEILGFH